MSPVMAPQALERVPRRPLSGAVFDQLLDRIVGGAFRPGQSLPPERQLCEELGVSRTAVREALARLVELRVIQVRHGGETRVLDFRATAGLDLLPRLLRGADAATRVLVIRSGLEMRAALTPEISRLAAGRGGPPHADELDAIVVTMSRTRDALPALHELSLQFWAAVVTGSDNLAYQLAFNSLRDAFGAIRDAATEAMAVELRDRRGYQAIADAIRASNGDAAAQATRVHINLGVAGLAAMLPLRPAGARGRKPRRAS